MRALHGKAAVLLAALGLWLTWDPATAADMPVPDAIMKMSGSGSGLCVVIGPPAPELPVQLASRSGLSVYVHANTRDQADGLSRAAYDAKLLGLRIFVDFGPPASLPLAENLADLVVAMDDKTPEAELRRVLRPSGKALVAGRTIEKALPPGADAWSHPYHGPDNNTLSADQLARHPYLTQFLAEPLFSSQPEVTVGAGGRLFKAFGHMAFRAYQNPSINQLMALSAYNGSLLWRKELKNGFMIHRNTMIATPDILYMGDAESCKLLDAATGDVKDQIAVPEGISDGPVWKWMAIADGVLYALVGASELSPPVAKGTETRIGGWPWGMWPGYDYADPKSAWGFGRTFIAIDLKTRKLLWHHKDEQYIDSRGTVLSNGRIYFYSPERFLACLDAKTGGELWRTSDAGLLDAIGPNGKAQHYITGFATSVYLRTNGKALLFAGPQRRSLVAVSAADGKLLWQKQGGNYQLVLRDNAIYALGAQGAKSYKLEYATGKVLAEFVGRRACTRATGTIDSILCRGFEGTIRWDVATDQLNHIAPMRPACHDGVVISDGMLHWGPWICGCHLTLVGAIGLSPANGFDFAQSADEARQFQSLGAEAKPVKDFTIGERDWPCFRADNRRSGVRKAAVPAASLLWESKGHGDVVPTAPVAAGGLVFVGGTDGAVRALNAATGEGKWTAFTAGPIFFPPAIAQGRAYVGSNDGHVYAFDAASGMPLWRYRVAPAQRKIPVYGQIISTWPVAGGVLVEGDTLYAAAGISHFDGTHVCALDAVTGKLRWHNNSAGTVDPNVKNGVSLCGPLALSGTELTFAGGNVYATARFDLKAGGCLNTPAGVRTTRRNFLFPRKLWEPLDGGEHPSPSGNIRIQTKRGAPGYTVTGPGWSVALEAYAGSALASDALLVLGRCKQGKEGRDDGGWQLLALKPADGSSLYSTALPGAAVHWGVAVDGEGRIIVALEDGRMVGLGRK